MCGRSSTRNQLELLTYRLMRGVAGRLGPRTLSGLGAAAGQLFLQVNRRRRQVLQDNLRLVFPDRTDHQRHQLAGAVARHFGRVSLDALRVLRLMPDELFDQVTVVGQEHLEAGLQRGRGLLLLSAHIGSWEVAALAAGLLIPGGMAMVTRPLDNPLLEAELTRLRRRFGNQPLGKRHVVRQVLRRLRAGGVVGMLIDQRSLERDGIEVPFFGLASRTHTTLARVALRTGAPVVPIWGLCRSAGHYTVRFEPAVLEDSLPHDQRNEVALTTRFNLLTEGIIRQYPTQWLWFHDRWRQLREQVRAG